MKKLLLTLTFAVFTFTLSAQEQAIKVNPIGLAFGVANIGYEFAVNEANTLTFSGLYYDRDNIEGFGVGAEYRFYFDKNALRGWHAGPSIGYLSLEDDFNNSAGIVAIGGEIGHQWILSEHFLVDTFAGLGVFTGESDAIDVNGVSLSLGVSIGYAW
jgi:hypothetical protein